MTRSRRPRRYSPLLTRKIHPQLLFLTGAAMVVLFLLQSNLLIRLIQVALFGMLATMNGKRIMWGYFLVMVGSITFFHLFQPAGEVLYRLGRFPVTAGALHTGLFKGLTIIGLVFISLFSIRPNLRLPGHVGGLLSGTLLYFERILEYRGGLRLHGLLDSIDRVLEEMFPVQELHKAEPVGGVSAHRNGLPPTTLVGYLFCVGLMFLNLGFIPMGRFLG
ncbi:hypothetical protein [Spirochaeta africana]|uniref:Uncharacterized protein n=1 Tax=Spirochaeta africana (strain ATCC 700263 / DSM 8902 / Z-7692) TaxID=889378 RepID=H9UKJ0_SPIAZ|nr:hypothetical protein [Spirochaeta africana]AFG38033.1 hypothetical protein Spiaf_1982 [Spirochaeta africana DSM 8902]